MRVISGAHKGRRIQAPKNLPVRPTTDRSKEGLFNILQHRLDFKAFKYLIFCRDGEYSYDFPPVVLNMFQLLIKTGVVFSLLKKWLLTLK